MPDIGRNDPCHCGSGKKYKKCCESKDAQKEHTQLEKKWKDAEKAHAKDQAEAAEAAKNETHPKHTPQQNLPKAAPQKHSTFVAPKFNMPRKAGGGG